MNVVNNEENGHSEGLFGAGSYELPSPLATKTDFLPWHRPRKQYVREVQWCTEIQRLLQKPGSFAGPVKYLGLPGTDLLDLRQIHESVCRPLNVPLLFLGFNSAARPQSKGSIELNISLDEVRRLECVDAKSDVIGDNFSRLAQTNSLAYARALAMGPFDVINLDLCDGFAIQSPSDVDETYYKAVSNILGIQSKSTRPWMLFLTTRTDKKNINERVLHALVRKYCDNLRESQVFRDASEQEFAIPDQESAFGAINSHRSLVDVFTTSLCKWFLGLALDGRPQTKVELISAYEYKVDPASDGNDLISISLKFSPTFHAPRDSLGLAGANTPNELDEGSLAAKALKRISKRVCTDSRLAGDEALNERMITRSEELLSQSRYNVAGYRRWLNGAKA